MYFFLVFIVPEAVQNLKVYYPALPPPRQDGEPAIVNVTVTWKVRDNNSFYQSGVIKPFIVICYITKCITVQKHACYNIHEQATCRHLL